MIKYSQKAVKALAFLFRPYNDIEIYVEDVLNRNMYEIIVQRILGEKARVKRIFPLNGKTEVIKACEKDQDASRNRLYIVDGDFEILLGIEKPDLKYLYRLGVYTSENLLISENAAIEISYENLPNEKREDICTMIQIDELIMDATQKLVPLFVLYAAVRSLELKKGQKIHIETSGYKVEKLGNNRPDGIELSKTKINKRISDIKTWLVRDYGCTETEINATIEDIERTLPDDTTQLTRYISGKTYLLPIIFHRLAKTAQCSSSKEQIKTRMARYCELDTDPNLSRAVHDAALGHELFPY